MKSEFNLSDSLTMENPYESLIYNNTVLNTGIFSIPYFDLKGEEDDSVAKDDTLVFTLFSELKFQSNSYQYYLFFP